MLHASIAEWLSPDFCIYQGGSVKQATPPGAAEA
jgi:hypothetical protein